MVEAAKAHNPFATKAAIEQSNHCPHMARLGVCLEPDMCFLIHKIPGAPSGAELSAQAKTFNPFTTGSTAASKDFVPPSQEQD